MRLFDAGTGDPSGLPRSLPEAAAATLNRGDRRRLGAYATPPALASDLVAAALDASPGADPVLLDPACGGGALLLAAARAGCLLGLERDEVAAATAEAAVAVEGRGATITTRDALTAEPWPRADVVVANPPFGADPTSPERFLLRALDEVADGGVAAFLLPTSFLATRRSAAARAAVRARAELVATWPVGSSCFSDAAVDVCAVVLRRRDAPNRPWPPTASVDLGPLRTSGRLGDRWTVAADFAAQYYEVVPHVVDDPGGALDDRTHPRLVTVGLVDPGACGWGERPARFAKRRWEAPRLDVASAPAWTGTRLVPKVVVATQTRVVEAAVDAAGTWFPSVPLLSVVAPPTDLWHAAAALLAPPVTAWALDHAAGAALSPDTIKLGAPQVRGVPLPPSGDDWDDAAQAVRVASTSSGDERRRALVAAGAATCRAYGLEGDGLLDWWVGRLASP